MHNFIDLNNTKLKKTACYAIQINKKIIVIISSWEVQKQEYTRNILNKNNAYNFLRYRYVKVIFVCEICR